MKTNTPQEKFEIFFNEYPFCTTKNIDKDKAASEFTRLSPSENEFEFILIRLADEKKARAFAKDNDIFYKFPVAPSEYLRRKLHETEVPTEKELLASKSKTEFSISAIRNSDVSEKEMAALRFIYRISEIEQSVFLRENPSCIYKENDGFRVAATWLRAWDGYTVEDMKSVIDTLLQRTEAPRYSKTLSLKDINRLLHQAKIRRIAPDYKQIKTRSAVDDEIEEMSRNEEYGAMLRSMSEAKRPKDKMKIFLDMRKKVFPSKRANESAAIEIAGKINGNGNFQTPV